MDTTYHNLTTIHPIVAAALAVASVWVLLGARRHVLVPLLAMSCFVSPAQRLVVGGLDLTVTKILLAVILVRLIVRGETRAVRFGRVDFGVIAWLVVGSAAFVMLRGTFDATINRIGWVADMLGAYAVFRLTLVRWTDFERAIRALVILSIPVAMLFAIEWSTGQNPFGALGGVEEITRIRDGKLRCQGAFAHPIIAGVFWAGLLPLFWVLRRNATHSQRTLPTLGILAALGVVFATASSTPLAAVLLAAFGLALFPLRGSMSMLRWGALAGLIAIHFIREKPAWHLLARIDLSGGSTGYHRYALVDAAITHFQEWALLGATSTEFLGIRDITNQYVLEGLNGGMLAMVAFALTLWFGFATIGRTLRQADLSPQRRRMVWALGVALAVHAVSFLAVSYFGQAYLVFLFTLAAIAAVPQLAAEHEESLVDAADTTIWPAARLA